MKRALMIIVTGSAVWVAANRRRLKAAARRRLEAAARLWDRARWYASHDRDPRYVVWKMFDIIIFGEKWANRRANDRNFRERSRFNPSSGEWLDPR